MRGIAGALPALLAATASFAGSQSGTAPPEPIQRLHFLASGEWISEETVEDRAGRKFQSVRVCTLEAGGHLVLCRGSYLYADGERTGVNLVAMYAWNSVREEVVNYAVFSHGGLIEGAYTGNLGTDTWEERFSYASGGVETQWKVVEKFISPDRFVEDAYVMKDGVWEQANYLTYVRKRP